MLPSVLSRFWEKRESFSAHFAWGLALELWFSLLGVSAETGFVAVLLIASAWEIGGEVVTTWFINLWTEIEGDPGVQWDRRPVLWKSRALDVPPWILGAAIGWISVSIRS